MPNEFMWEWVKSDYNLMTIKDYCMNTFKPGDLVFYVDVVEGISLHTLSKSNYSNKEMDGKFPIYIPQCHSFREDGRAYDNQKLPQIFHATKEVREWLVTGYGEDAVPKIPLRGSELARYMVNELGYKYITGYAGLRDDSWVSACRIISLCVGIHGEQDEHEGLFKVYRNDGLRKFPYFVPTDAFGKEITELDLKEAPTKSITEERIGRMPR